MTFFRKSAVLIFISLTYLFKIVVRLGVVPTDFGCGVVIPLVKNTDGDVTSSDNYRGITLTFMSNKDIYIKPVGLTSIKICLIEYGSLSIYILYLCCTL